MQLLKPDGKPAGLVTTDAKKAHDPDEVKKITANLARLCADLLARFRDEMRPKDDRPPLLHIDLAKVREHYAEQYRSVAAKVNATDFPHPVDEELVGKEIDRLLAADRNRYTLQMPLRAVPDLAQQGWLPVGAIPAGTLWINDRCAVAISDEGANTLWLRTAHEPMELWCQGWLPEPERQPVLVATNYTLGELHTLLGSMRVTEVVKLTEQQMNACRQHSTPTRPWWLRW